MAAFTLSEYFSTNFHGGGPSVQSESKIATANAKSESQAAAAAQRQRLYKSKYLNPIKSQRGKSTKTNSNHEPLVISISNTNSSNSNLNVVSSSSNGGQQLQRGSQAPVAASRPRNTETSGGDIDDFGLRKSLIDPELNKKISDLCWRLSIKDTQQRNKQQQQQQQLDHKQLLSQQLKANNLNINNLPSCNNNNFLPKIGSGLLESASTLNLNKLAGSTRKQQSTKTGQVAEASSASSSSALTAAFLVDLNRQSLESVSMMSGMSSENQNNLNKNRFFLNYLLNRKAYHNQLGMATSSNGQQIPIKIHANNTNTPTHQSHHLTSTHRGGGGTLVPSDSPTSLVSNISHHLEGQSGGASLTTAGSSSMTNSKSRCSSITSSKAEFGDNSKIYFKYDSLNASTSTRLNDQQDSFLSVNKMPSTRQSNRLKPLYLSNKSQVELEEYLNIAGKVETKEKPKGAKPEKTRGGANDKSSPKRNRRVLVSQDTLSSQKSLFEQTISSPPSSTSPQLSPFEQSSTLISPNHAPRSDKSVKTPSPILALAAAADSNKTSAVHVRTMSSEDKSPNLEKQVDSSSLKEELKLKVPPRSAGVRLDSRGESHLNFDFTRVESPHKLGKAMASGYKFVSHSSMNVGVKHQTTDYSQQFEMFQSTHYSHPNFHGAAK